MSLTLIENTLAFLESDALAAVRHREGNFVMGGRRRTVDAITAALDTSVDNLAAELKQLEAPVFVDLVGSTALGQPGQLIWMDGGRETPEHTRGTTYAEARAAVARTTFIDENGQLQTVDGDNYMQSQDGTIWFPGMDNYVPLHRLCVRRHLPVLPPGYTLGRKTQLYEGLYTEYGYPDLRERSVYDEMGWTWVENGRGPQWASYACPDWGTFGYGKGEVHACRSGALPREAHRSTVGVRRWVSAYLHFSD